MDCFQNLSSYLCFQVFLSFYFLIVFSIKLLLYLWLFFSVMLTTKILLDRDYYWSIELDSLNHGEVNSLFAFKFLFVLEASLILPLITLFYFLTFHFFIYLILNPYWTEFLYFNLLINLFAILWANQRYLHFLQLYIDDFDPKFQWQILINYAQDSNSWDFQDLLKKSFQTSFYW